MDITILKKLDLGDKEIKVYLSLLEYGAISVRGLAEITELNRGTVYDILKKLQDLGLVSYFHKKTKQQFSAEDPDKILQLLESREKELKNTKGKLNELIPELRSLQEKDGSKPVTKFYDGQKGIKNILEDVIGSMNEAEEREYYIYSAKHGSDDLNSAFPDFTKERIKKKISVKAISLAKGGGTSGLDERRWLGTNDESATFIIIYAGKCAFVSRDLRNKPVGVIIENKMIYETQKLIFQKLWKVLK